MTGHPKTKAALIRFLSANPSLDAEIRLKPDADPVRTTRTYLKSVGGTPVFLTEDGKETYASPYARDYVWREDGFDLKFPETDRIAVSYYYRVSPPPAGAA